MKRQNYNVLIMFAAMTVVMIFLIPWITHFVLNSKKKARKYYIVVFDVYGKKMEFDGIRTEFKNHDVAWSYAKFYKEQFRLYNFGVIRDSDASRQTLVRYI